MDDLFETELMQDYSHAIVIEGDAPARFGDTAVYVCPPLSGRASLFVRAPGGRLSEAPTMADVVRRMLKQPDGVERLFAEMTGLPFAEIARRHPVPLVKARAALVADLATFENMPAPERKARWAVRPGYDGIEHAHVVVANIRHASETRGASRLLDELKRLRQETHLFDDVLGWRGTRVPITAVAANLLNPRDPGTRKVLTRVRRAVRAGSDMGHVPPALADA